MLKSKLEALLFSSGRKMDIEELSKLVHSSPDKINASLTELKEEYDEKNTSTMLVNEGNSWKITVREQFLPLVQKIVTETELSRTIMETLAIIAFKYPIKQSDLIKIRTNKAYDHLKELQEMGYITRQKHGRTNLIKLTQKFFEYFDLPETKLKEVFKDFSSIAKAIEEKEKEVDTIKEDQRKAAAEESQKDEKIKEGIDSLDKETEGMETYGTKEPQEKENMGNLEVVDERSDEDLEKERERLADLKAKDKQTLEQQQKPKFEGPGIKVTGEMEKIIDKKVENILHPPPEVEDVEETPLSEAEKTKKESQKEKDLLEASMEEKEEKQDKEEK
jgi:segregation and condensation protein B